VGALYFILLFLCAVFVWNCSGTNPNVMLIGRLARKLGRELLCYLKAFTGDSLAVNKTPKLKQVIHTSLGVFATILLLAGLNYRIAGEHTPWMLTPAFAASTAIVFGTPRSIFAQVMREFDSLLSSWN